MRKTNIFRENNRIRFDDNGIPILSMQQKLAALNKCIISYDVGPEDAAGHLCDLLEFCRQRIHRTDGTIFEDLHAMVDIYGSHPVKIEL